MLPHVLLSSLLSLAIATPQVKLGDATIVGRDVTLLKQDFFGGNTSPPVPSPAPDVLYRAAIPYAEPPLGALRLRHPVLKTSPGNGTFDASHFGPACLQVVRPDSVIHFHYDVKAHLGLFKDGFPGINTRSEDCLTINIFRPSGLSNDTALPVLFWTYVFVHFLTHVVAS